MDERIQDQAWHKQTVTELRRYRVIKKRIEIIEIQLRKQCGPDAKAIAAYGINTYGSTNPDEISRLEVELEEKQTKLAAIDKSFEALGELERKIIELKFKQGHNDYAIYCEREFMSPSTYYKHYNEAITKIAKCLGKLEC